MPTADVIRDKLNNGLKIDHLDIDDESHMHNVPAGAQSHFRVVVVSDEFDGVALIGRHRSINALLKEELAGSVHALALHTYTPDEWRARNESAGASPECLGGSKR